MHSAVQEPLFPTVAPTFRLIGPLVMAEVKVAITGALGRMGAAVLGAVEAEPGFLPVGGADTRAASDTIALPGGSGEIPLFPDVGPLIEHTQPDVLVDFTDGEGAAAAIRAAVPAGVRVVSGSTGIPQAVLREAEELVAARGTGVVLASNFALGAVLLGHLAGIAARYFDYADISEGHHEQKIDAPSGTALSLLDAVIAGKGSAFTSVVPEKETLVGTRGGTRAGVNVHSARMPGRLAHHEVVFGAPGQTLALTHDSINRDCFMPGVILAIRHVLTVDRLIVGLDRVLGLEQSAKVKP